VLKLGHGAVELVEGVGGEGALIRGDHGQSGQSQPSDPLIGVTR
jgi:hypothetical protein